MKNTLLSLIAALACFSFAHYLDISYPFSLGVVIPIGFTISFGVIFAFMAWAAACDWLLNDQSPEYHGRRRKVKKTRA
jgi:hypothetical protein